MTRDEAIAQLSNAGGLASEAIGVLEALEGDPELTLLHGIASRLGFRLEDKLGVGRGTIVKAFDGTPKT